MGDYSRFTDRARKVMQLANQEAQRLGHSHLDAPHIFIGLCKEGNGVAAKVLERLMLDPSRLMEAMRSHLTEGPSQETGRLPHTPSAMKVVESAIAEAKSLGHNYVGTEHLLLGLLSYSGTIGTLAAFGVTEALVRESLAGLWADCEEKQAEPVTERPSCEVRVNFAGAHKLFSEGLQENPDTAWGYQCNLAMVMVDAGLGHEKANRAAANFMAMAFDCDTRTRCEKEFGKQWKEQSQVAPKPSQTAMQIAARVWCDQEMRHLVMDTDAARGIAKIVDYVLENQRKDTSPTRPIDPPPGLVHAIQSEPLVAAVWASAERAGASVEVALTVVALELLAGYRRMRSLEVERLIGKPRMVCVAEPLTYPEILERVMGQTAPTVVESAP